MILQLPNPKSKSETVHSSGPRNKPKDCLTCPLHGTSSGFVPDAWHSGDKIKVGVLKFMPTTAEINENYNCPLESESMWEDLLKGSGLDLANEIGFSNILRCKMKAEKVNKSMFAKTSLICRQYDNQRGDAGKLVNDNQSLYKFDPNAFIITYDLKAILTAVAHKVFLRRAFTLAATLAEKNYRPLILMGIEVAQLVNPTLFDNIDSYDRETSFKAWVGHWWLGEWPFGCKDVMKSKFVEG